MKSLMTSDSLSIILIILTIWTNGMMILHPILDLRHIGHQSTAHGPSRQGPVADRLPTQSSNKTLTIRHPKATETWHSMFQPMVKGGDTTPHLG